MFRAIPMSNKLCFDKDVKRSWKIHEQKINNLRSSVSNEPPQKFKFLDSRKKKIALAEVRNMEVDRENQALLKRMKQIDSKGYTTSYTRLYQDLSDKKKKTLNEPFRKRELIKVIGENQQLLKRLQQKHSSYSIKKMEKQRKLIQKNISLISQFPYKKYRHSHTPVNMWATSDNCLVHTSHTPDANFTFKGERQVQGVNFYISTYLSKGNFYLQMEGVQKHNEKYRIQLPEQKAKDLLRISYCGSIQRMINHLNIDHEKQMCFLKYNTNLDIVQI